MEFSHLFCFSGGNKAGMQEMDKDKQAQVIYEMSKDSAYFKRSQYLDDKTNEKIEIMINKINLLTKSQIDNLNRQVQLQLSEIEAKRSFDRLRCVLDMDMFFAAVEIRDNPSIKDLPVAVGGNSMIGTANYIARKYGVRSAMPGFIAKKLCPHLVFVPPHFDKYEEVSRIIVKIIKEYDPFCKSHSLDEVYFDITNSCRMRLMQRKQSSIIFEDHNSETDSNSEDQDHNLEDISILELRTEGNLVIEEIRLRIKEETGGLTSSCGLANNYLLAKICADVNKPMGQFEIKPLRNEIISFFQSLPIRKVNGIGKVTERILNKLNIFTMGDLYNNLYKVIHVMSPGTASTLIRASIGVSEEELNGTQDNSKTSSDELDRKSIGVERTFNTLTSSEDLYQKLHELCITLSQELESKKIKGKCVNLKLKTTAFEVFHRSSVVHRYIQTSHDIELIAKSLLEKMLPISIRLMGVSMTKLQSEIVQAKSTTLLSLCNVSQSKDDSPTNTSIQLKENLICPICEAVFHSLLDLNAHLDCICLRQKTNDNINVLPPKKKIKNDPKTNSEACKKIDIASYFMK